MFIYASSLYSISIHFLIFINFFQMSDESGVICKLVFIVSVLAMFVSPVFWGCGLISARISWERMVTSPPLWNICDRPAVSLDNRPPGLSKKTHLHFYCVGSCLQTAELSVWHQLSRGKVFTLRNAKWDNCCVCVIVWPHEITENHCWY